MLEAIGKLFSSEPFGTVITGLLLYLATQLIKDYFIDPLLEYRSLRQRIIFTIKMYCCYYNNPYDVQRKSGNARSKEEYDFASLEIRKIGAELASYIGNVFKKSKKKKLTEVQDALIGISNGFYKLENYNPSKDNKQCENVIKKNLKFE